MTEIVKKRRYIRLSEVAEICDISLRTLYRLIDEGEMPRPIKIGKMNRIDEGKLYEYLDKKEKGVET